MMIKDITVIKCDRCGSFYHCHKTEDPIHVLKTDYTRMVRTVKDETYTYDLCKDCSQRLDNFIRRI